MNDLRLGKFVNINGISQFRTTEFDVSFVYGNRFGGSGTTLKCEEKKKMFFIWKLLEKCLFHTNIVVVDRKILR